MTIESVGGRGDGTARSVVRVDGEDRERVIFIPYTLTGERVLAQPVSDRGEGIVAMPAELVEASPDRIDPPCPHFMSCGGCALQHWRLAPYQAWKVAQIRNHLERAGVDAPPFEPLASSNPRSRRRATLAARRTAGGTVVGFHQRAGTRIESIRECPVLTDTVVATLAPLREALQTTLDVGAAASITVNELDSGLDMLVTLPRPPGLEEREIWADFASRCDLARLSVQIDGDALPPEPLAARKPAVMRFGGVDVVPPAGAFLQATADGETAIREVVLEAAAGADARLDLFSGVGTLALPLATNAPVRAVDGDAAAVAALRAGADAAGLGQRLVTETRDLFSRPFEDHELTGIDMVVFDPPRAGAKAQAAALAASRVPVVVAVSCNPATFARDAATLVAGGYHLVRIRPIDQFLWSPHIELAAVFHR